MTLKPPEILQRLGWRFGLVVLLTLIGAIAGAVYGAIAQPTYRAQAYVVVTAEAGESVAALNYAQAYGRIATKGPVADRAAAALGSRRGLGRVTASTSPDAPVIEITAKGHSAKQTAAVANAMAQALVDVGVTRKDQTRVGLAVLASASTPTTPTSPKPPWELVVGAAGGLLVGGLAVLAGAAGRGPASAGVARHAQPPGGAGPPGAGAGAEPPGVGVAEAEPPGVGVAGAGPPGVGVAGAGPPGVGVAEAGPPSVGVAEAGPPSGRTVVDGPSGGVAAGAGPPSGGAVGRAAVRQDPG